MPRMTNLADALRKEGVKVVEVAGWQTRGKETFAPKIVLAHHTASRPGSNVPSLNICINGRSDLPGPLAQIVLARDGTAYVIAAGRANHAGDGLWAGVSGNSNAFGIEAENSGTGEPWSNQQMEAYIKVCAALCRLIGVGADKVCAHYEYALPKGRKIDPFGHSDFMNNFRARVGRQLKGSTPTPTPSPETPEEKEEKELMAAKDDILAAIEKTKPFAARASKGGPVWIISPTGKFHVERETLNSLYFSGIIRADKNNDPVVLNKEFIDSIPSIG